MAIFSLIAIKLTYKNIKILRKFSLWSSSAVLATRTSTSVLGDAAAALPGLLLFWEDWDYWELQG